MPLKGDVGGHALNSNGNYIVDHGKSWKNHGIVFLNFCGNTDVNKTGLSGLKKKENDLVVLQKKLLIYLHSSFINTQMVYFCNRIYGSYPIIML